MDSDLADFIKALNGSYIGRREYEAHREQVEEDHRRLNSLERLVWKAIGATSVFTAFGTAIAVVVLEHVWH